MSGFKTIGFAYNRTKNFLKEGLFFIIKLPLWIPGKINEGHDYFASMKSKLKDFYKTNLDLGLYHLRQGNINDAIMRFKIVDIFISKGDGEANYWLGWSYFLKNNYPKALDVLKKAGTGKAGPLINFITNYGTISEVPEDILKIQSSLRAYQELQVNGNYVINLPKEFVSELLEAVEELPKECAILDLGCSGGFIGKLIDDKLQKNYHLTGVEDREKMIENIKQLKEYKRRIYDDLRRESVRDFLSKNQEEYNIIISFNSLNFAKNLTSYFKQINEIVKKGGYFALLLACDDNEGWNSSKNQFIYDSREVSRQLKLAKFDIVGIKEWKLNRLNNYTAFICKK